MIVLSGRVVDVTKRTAGKEPNTWEEDVVHVLDGRRVLDVKAGRDFGPLPAIGEDVTMAVWVRAYSGKNGAGLDFTGTARLDDDVAAGLRAVG